MEKPSYTAITVERRGDADSVTLNRPERLNALDHAMVDDVLESFGAAAEDWACRVIVLRGAGRAFCAGVDIKETTSARVEDPTRLSAPWAATCARACRPSSRSGRLRFGQG